MPARSLLSLRGHGGTQLHSHGILKYLCLNAHLPILITAFLPALSRQQRSAGDSPHTWLEARPHSHPAQRWRGGAAPLLQPRGLAPPTSSAPLQLAPPTRALCVTVGGGASGGPKTPAPWLLPVPVFGCWLWRRGLRVPTAASWPGVSVGAASVDVGRVVSGPRSCSPGSRVPSWTPGL